MVKHRKSLYLALLSAAFCYQGRAQAPTPQLWYWHHSYINSDSAVQSSEALIDQALAAGYTGVAFWDSSFSFMSDSFWPSANVTRMKTVMAYAASKGLKVLATPDPFGASNDALQVNPNLAEAQRVVGTQFTVNSSKTQLQIVNSFPGLQNPGFEAGKVDWFDLGDAGVTVDTTTAHSGIASALIQNAPANARLRQELTLKPWREYHVRLFYKSQNFSGFSQLGIFDVSNSNELRLNPQFSISANQGWTEVDYMFNSQDSTQAWMYLGVWGGSSGKLWFDDILVEETALVYTIRRDGTPVKVYDPENGTVYAEGTDYNYIIDPRINSTRTPYTDPYHTPPTVTLPAGTHLTAGQTVTIDSYSVFPIAGTNGAAMCLTDSGVLTWLKQNAQSIQTILPSGAGVFLQYDELRQANSCLTCKAKNMTAGQLLAWNVGQSIQTYNSVAPGAPIYIWSDMFDPYHNAVANYFDVEGTLAGSWEGLPANVTIMNWNLGNLQNSLRWFSGQNASQPVAHEQIIAGYYDSGNGTSAATSELSSAAGVPGVMGLMYTTWSDDYSQLANFANAAKAAWPAYLASISGSSTTSGAVQLISKNSGKCIDVPQQSKASGVDLQQYSCNGGTNQQWNLIPVGNNEYEITGVGSGMSLDVQAESTANGARVIQYPYWGGPNEKWMLSKTADGYYNIVSVNSGKCLEVYGGGAATQSGDAIDQWACWGGDNQKWSETPEQ